MSSTTKSAYAFEPVLNPTPSVFLSEADKNLVHEKPSSDQGVSILWLASRITTKLLVPALH